MLAPSSTRRAASLAERVERALHALRARRSIGQVMSIVAASNTSWDDLAQLLELRVARIGWSITSWCACSGDSSSRLTSAPTPRPRLITTASRIGSIGGFVTCANSCLK